jgi:hypothetical protein
VEVSVQLHTPATFPRERPPLFIEYQGESKTKVAACLSLFFSPLELQAKFHIHKKTVKFIVIITHYWRKVTEEQETTQERWAATGLPERKVKILEFERRSSRSPCLGKSVCRRLLTCLKTDYALSDWKRRGFCLQIHPVCNISWDIIPLVTAVPE